MPNVVGNGGSLGAAARDALRQASLGPARRSYNRVGAAAQYRQLSRSAAGRRALELTGVTVSDRTARRWLTRQQSPSRRNQAAIHQAYDAARRGGIPQWVKLGEMRITGRVTTGRFDDRVRGEGGNTPLLIDNSKGYWASIEGEWDDLEDDDLEELIAEDLISNDIGDGSDGWGFPGGAYTVTISGR